MQGIFLAFIFGGIFYFYPRTSMEIEGSKVSFSSVNSNVIIISKNSDFSDSRFLDLKEEKNISFNLEPGRYYWKSSNSVLESFSNEFVLDEHENESEHQEGIITTDVKLKITKDEDGVLTGEVIFKPENEQE
jgi:hypothetical protein